MNAINKPNEVSMFKVGDYLVANNNHQDNELFKIDRKGCYGGLYDEKWRLLKTSEFRHATPEEIAAGHRIESSNGQAISDCILSKNKENEKQSDLSIKQDGQDMGDDSHIENHISPNCKQVK